jgi:hypothetical protein
MIYVDAISGFTWRWDGTTAWQKLAVATPTVPALSGANVIAAGGADVLLGNDPSAGMWRWNGSAWSRIAANGPAPSARVGASFASLGDKFVLFGGEGNGHQVLQDTWTWDGAAWTQVATVGPPGRAFAAMAAIDGGVVLYGGWGDVTTIEHTLADTWTWDGASWTQRGVPGPTPRAEMVVATVP